MEDAYTAVPFLLEVPLPTGDTAPEELVPPRIAGQVRSISGCLPDSAPAATPRQAASLPSQLSAASLHAAAARTSASAPLSSASSATQGAEMSALHFFGVFDGHGGADAALLCARTLHERLAEALHGSSLAARPTFAAQLPEASGNSTSSSCTAVSVRSASDADGPDGTAAAPCSGLNVVSVSDSDPPSATNSVDMDVDEAAAAPPPRPAPQFTANAFKQAFTEAFFKVDEEFGRAKDAAQVGTTAVVALVGDRQLYVGNCGAPLTRHPPIRLCRASSSVCAHALLHPPSPYGAQAVRLTSS